MPRLNYIKIASMGSELFPIQIFNFNGNIFFDQNNFDLCQPRENLTEQFVYPQSLTHQLSE
jgi:hypothetical protein